MTKPALMAVMLMSMAVSGAAQAAQWRKVSAAPGNVFYIDTRVVKKDKTRKVWSLRTYAKAQQTPEGKPYRSVKAQHLYSCEDRTAVMLSQVFYPETMGRGEPVENYIYEKFSPEEVTPGSPFEKALSKVCKR